MPSPEPDPRTATAPRPRIELNPAPSSAPTSFEDARLLERVRPAEWTNPIPAPRYDLVVVGGGTAGLVTAAGAAQLGARVALVERGLLGGDCLNYGCVPSKALLASARHAAAARRGRAFGVHTGPVSVDFPAVMRRMRRIRARLAEQDSVHRFRELGVDVFLGQAAFLDPSTLQVGDLRLPFSRACLATGSRPLVPPIEGLDQVRYLTNESLFGLEELPPRLAVLGAGPTGVELAQAFARFGSRVHLIEREQQLLPGEDPDAGEWLAAALREDGASLWLGTELQRVRPGPGERGAILRLDDRVGQDELEVDALLVAAGRRPNLEGLGLEAAGIQIDQGGVVVDDRLRTTNRRVFAAGDVCLPLKFTHTADAAARLVIRNALFAGRRRLSKLTVPWCIYTEPAVGHVGLTRREADEQGISIDTWRVDLSRLDRAVLDGDERGFVVVHTPRGKGTILGATVVAAEAGGIVAELTAAMVTGVGLDELSEVIAPYPTEVEAIRRVADEYRRARLTPPVKNALGVWLGLRRLLHV